MILGIKSTRYLATDNLFDYQFDYHVINTGCQQPYFQGNKKALKMA